MRDRRRYGTFLLLLLILLSLCVLLSRTLDFGKGRFSEQPPTVVAGPAPVSSQEEGLVSDQVWVDVSGAVRREGVYQLFQGARVNDAVEAAGGLSADADRNAVNLALPVRDGQKILIPAQKPASIDGGGEKKAESRTVRKGTYKSRAHGVINVNRATREELISLPGVGPVTADRILERRGQKPFVDLTDLGTVKGIGEVKLRHLEPWVEF